MARIDLVDVSMRDGNQSLWGATGLSTAQILEIAGQVDRVGFKAIDFMASSHMGTAVRNQRNNPWERIRRARAAMPRTPLQFITTGLRFISWEEADPEFMRVVFRCLQRNGIRRIKLVESMHDVDAALRAARMFKEEGGGQVMAALTYTISDVHDDAFYAAYAAKVKASPNVDLFCIKDPGGLLSPERARTLVPAIRAVIGDMPLELHSHSNVGYSQLSGLAAADSGISAIHVGIGPLGDGSSLPEAGRMIANLREAGHTVDIDDAVLARVDQYWRRLAKAEGLPAGAPASFDASFLRHQIAGGVMSTTRRQLQEINLEHKLPEVIAETERVRRELGQPIMVTPFPQVVISQALFNVIGRKRYEQVSDQVIRYVLGKFGRPPNPVDPKVRDAVLDRPRAREIEREPSFPSYADLRKRIGVDMNDEEFLLRAVMQGDYVDAMLKHGASVGTYNPDAAPFKKLLRELAARPAARDIMVEGKGFRLALHAGGAID